MTVVFVSIELGLFALFLLVLACVAWQVFGVEVREYRSRRRQAKRAATVLAGTFVGSCGHTVAIPADYPPVLTCGACGTRYLRQFTAEQSAAFNLGAIRAFMARTEALSPTEEAPAVTTERPREVYPTIGEEDEGPDDQAAVTGVRMFSDEDTVGPDIEDVSDVV